MILQQIRNPESQVRINADGNLILKTVLGRFLIVFKIKDVYDAGSWIYNLNSALNYNEEGTGTFILNALKIAL